ncbi:MAG: hypothetical protein WEE36_00285 [Acidimicrobiia bacterium]
MRTPTMILAFLLLTAACGNDAPTTVADPDPITTAAHSITICVEGDLSADGPWTRDPYEREGFLEPQDLYNAVEQVVRVRSWPAVVRLVATGIAWLGPGTEMCDVLFSFSGAGASMHAQYNSSVECYTGFELNLSVVRFLRATPELTPDPIRLREIPPRTIFSCPTTPSRTRLHARVFDEIQSWVDGDTELQAFFADQ